MERYNILILVKTYPSISQKYRETVCTAGLLLDKEFKPSSWIRIYPIRYRNLDNDKRFQKWTIISAKIERNDRDHRDESYRIDDGSIEIIRQIDYKYDAWQERRNFLLPFQARSTSEIRDSGKSLGLIKPKQVKRSLFQADSRDWSPKQQAVLDQKDLLEPERDFKDLEKIPYKFFYEFIEEDNTRHKYSIIDWEIYQLYRNCRNRAQSNGEQDTEKIAVQKVIQKLDYLAYEKDLYLIIGSIKNHPQNFVVIGRFSPPIIEYTQLSLLGGQT